MMITIIELKDTNNIPLSRTTTNKTEINVPVKVIYKKCKLRDKSIGNIKRRSFVISNDIIFDIG